MSELGGGGEVCFSLTQVLSSPAISMLMSVIRPSFASGATYKGKRTVADSEDNLDSRWTFEVLELFLGHFQILLAFSALDQANHNNQATT